MYTITVFYSINDSDSELIMKHGAVTVINVFNANLYLSIRLIYWKIRDSRPTQLKTLIFTNVHDFVDHITGVCFCCGASRNKYISCLLLS